MIEYYKHHKKLKKQGKVEFDKFMDRNFKATVKRAKEKGEYYD